MGFSEPVRRSTLADANEARDWRIYAELAQRLIAQARIATSAVTRMLGGLMHILLSHTVDQNLVDSAPETAAQARRPAGLQQRWRWALLADPQQSLQARRLVIGFRLP